MEHIESASTHLSLPVLISVANTLNVSSDDLICDNLTASREAYKNSIISELEDYGDKKLWLLSDSMKSIKASYRSL